MTEWLSLTHQQNTRYYLEKQHLTSAKFCSLEEVLSISKLIYNDSCWYILNISTIELMLEETSNSMPPENKKYLNNTEDNYLIFNWGQFSVQFTSVAQSCLTLCDPMNRSTPGLPVHDQLPESTQAHVHWVGDAIQPSHPLPSPSPPAPNPSQHQGLFQWVNSSHGVAKVLEFQLQHLKSLVMLNFISKVLPLKILFLSETYLKKLISYSFPHDTLSNIWIQLYLL